MTAADYAVNFPNGVILDADDLERVKSAGYMEILKIGYACITTGRMRTRKRTYLHRFITNAPSDKQVDHINGNKLDNRKSNLRLVTNMQNSQNTGWRKHNTSGFMGVTWSNQRNKWMSKIVYEGKQIHLGFYEDIEEAASIRYAAETQLLGEYAPYVGR